MSIVSDLSRKAELSGELTPAEIVALLEAHDARELYAAADRVRARYVGEEVWLRGLVEISSYCRRNCCYCGLRSANRKAARYRLTLDEIMACVRQIKAAGLGTVVLQAGEDGGFGSDGLLEIIRRIKAETGLAITLSLGEFEPAVFEEFKAAGADRYLLRFETSSPALYAGLHPEGTLENRIECLRQLKRLGFETGSGFLIGLPGQSLADIAADIGLLKELTIDMIGVGPFIACPDTPLAHAANGSVELTLKVMAIIRLLTRDTNMPATTALGVLEPAARKRALEAGCNVLMPVFTPQDAAKNYLIYPGKAARRSQLENELETLPAFLAAIGRAPGYGPGFRTSTRTECEVSNAGNQ